MVKHAKKIRMGSLDHNTGFDPLNYFLKGRLNSEVSTGLLGW